MFRHLFFIAFLLFVSFLPLHAQQWLQVHHQDRGHDWVMPFRLTELGGMRVSDRPYQLHLDLVDAEGTPTQQISLSLDDALDSLTLAAGLEDEQKGHSKYEVFTLHIHTLDAEPIEEKELWVPCHFSLDGRGQYSHYSGTGRIRGRGNSTWEWYDKKPYKFKLDEKSKLLGLEKARNWNLLANYRDVTDMMNVYAFECARRMGMPFTNHSRFVEVFLNGDYIGVYQLTEKLEVGKHRVDIDEEKGVLLSFDLDDGPSLSPGAGDNFWSKVYALPLCVKHPEEPTQGRLDSIRADFAVLEKAVSQHNFPLVDSLMDVRSFISILQLHEYLYNVEIAAPRSLYMFKDAGGKYTFGPVWDWDAGFDFEWSNMYTGHDYFASHRPLLYGTQPATGQGASHRLSGFWTDLFQNAEFVARYKQQWKEVSDSLLEGGAWDEVNAYVAALSEGSSMRDIARWPIPGKTPEVETGKMHEWLTQRLAYLNKVVAAYPDGEPFHPEDATDEIAYQYSKDGVTVTCPVKASRGYEQQGMIELSKEDIVSLMGVTPNVLVPLNSDGSQGRNTAAGTYGAWFDASGNTNDWSRGHVYIESSELFTWHFGCHPDNCRAGDKHTVRMQFARNRKTFTVTVHFVVK